MTGAKLQLDFFSRWVRPPPPSSVIVVGPREVPIRFVRNRRARRYILRVDPTGGVRATVPRGGSAKEARAFAERNLAWIAKQLQRPALPPVAPRHWTEGTEIFYRGQQVKLVLRPGPGGAVVQFGDQTVPVATAANLRRAVERQLWSLARGELTARTLALAAQHGLTVARVTVRNQRSKWGSCSPRRTISLNWRLIQAPEFVRDYLILHELMHLHEMNHSARFWRHVEQACPRYAAAESWLKQQRGLLW